MLIDATPQRDSQVSETVLTLSQTTEKSFSSFVRPFDDLLLFAGDLETSIIHLVDIENLAGSGYLTELMVRQTRLRYARATGFCSADLIVIAAAPHNATVVRSGWPGAVYTWRRGKDGADHLLVDVYQSLHRPGIFSRLIIGSGDHSFAPIANSAVAIGLPVTIVCSSRSRSRGLAMHHFVDLGSSSTVTSIDTTSNTKGRK